MHQTKIIEPCIDKLIAFPGANLIAFPFWGESLILDRAISCIHIDVLLRSCFNCMAISSQIQKLSKTSSLGPKSLERAGGNNPGCGTAQGTLNQEAAWWLLSKSPAPPAGLVPRTPQHHRNWNPYRGVKEFKAPEIQVPLHMRYSGSVKS